MSSSSSSSPPPPPAPPAPLPLPSSAHSSTSSFPRSLSTPSTALPSFTRLLDPPSLRLPSFNSQRNDSLLPSELSAIDLRSLRFNNPSIEASFCLSQACVSVVAARPISLALAAANLLYSTAEVLRLEPYSNGFLFVVYGRAVGTTLLIFLVYLLLHCVSNELSERISAGNGPSDLFTVVNVPSIKISNQGEENEGHWNQSFSFDEVSSLESGTFRRSPSSSCRKSSILQHFGAIISRTFHKPRYDSKNMNLWAGSSSIDETRFLVDNPSIVQCSGSVLNERPPKTSLSLCCSSKFFPRLVTSKNYPYFIASTTVILSLIGTLNVYLYPDNGNQYLTWISLVFYWAMHHASFTLPWQFAVSASVCVSVPVLAVVWQLPIAYRQEVQKTVFVLAVVYVALVYGNYFREMQSRKMFWLLEKAKAGNSTVEKAVVMNTKNEARSEFIANVSHEMRTPLSAVICAASLLMDGNLPPDEVLQLAKIVHSTSETLSVLINDVLDFASCEANRLSLRPSPVSLVDLANDTIACLAPGFALKRLDLACHVDTQLSNRKVMCDGSRLTQILVNLLNNGMKFTATGGVALNMDVVSYDNPNYPQNVTVHICIEDSGMGIPADAISQLGDRFYQVDSGAKKPAGTGLGLFISRALIENMGSHWTVSSILGHGTKFEFTLTLPLASAGAGPESDTASDLEAVLKTFSPEDEPSRWHCLLLGGSVLARRSFLKHLEDLKVATAEDATPDECMEEISAIPVQSHASSPMPSSSASRSLPHSSIDHQFSSVDDSARYRDLQHRIRDFTRRVRIADPHGIPVLFADECFVPQNLGLDPLKKHETNSFAVLDRAFDLDKPWGIDLDDASCPVKNGGKEEECEKHTHLFPILVRHRLYNDKSGESFSRSSSRGMARPLFAESATSMEYEDHVRDLGNNRRSSYCSTDTNSPSKRGSFSADAFVSPLFWAPLNKPVTAGGVARTMRTAFSARAMWQKPATRSLSPVPSPELDNESEVETPGKCIGSQPSTRFQRTSGEQAGETLCTTTRNPWPIAGPEIRTSPNSRRPMHRRHTASAAGTTVPESANPIRVLVAEDNAVIVSVVTRILAIAGFKAEIATDGERALKMFEDSIDSESQRSAYGVIMMDVRMDRMDGVTCGKRIRQLEISRHIRRTPILGTSGQEIDRNQEEFPFDAILSKPYDRPRLVKTLREWVDRKRYEVAARSTGG